MKFLSEKELQNIETIEQDVPKLVYFKLISVGPKTLDQQGRNLNNILKLIQGINGYICLPQSKEDLKGEICQMIDKIYE